MNPLAELGSRGEVPHQVPSMDRLVVGGPITDGKEPVHALLGCVSPCPEIAWAVGKRGVEVGDPKRGVVARGQEIAPEAKTELCHHLAVCDIGLS